MKLGQAQEPVRPAGSGLGTNAQHTVFVSQESRDLYGSLRWQSPPFTRLVPLRSNISRVFQMNQWLGKFWTDSSPFRIVAVGDRDSLRSFYLERILGGNCKSEWCDGKLGAMNSDNITYRRILNGVDVDVALVPALSDVAGYKSERYIRAIQDRMGNAQSYDLVIFCVNMSDTRLRGSVLRTFQELNTDWSRTIIALTFADALPALTRHRNNPDFHKGQHFNSKLAEWTRELKAILEHIGVQQEVIAKMNMYPCTCDPEDLLPNGEPWLAPLSLAIMEILSPEKKTAFLKEHAIPLPTVAAAMKQTAVVSPTSGAAAEAMVKSSVNEMTEVQPSSKRLKSDLQMSSASSSISDDQVQNIRAALSKLRKDCPVFGILVIGRTGVGKSTLINNLLGKEVASVGHTLKSETPMVKPHEYSVEGVPIIVYDTPGLGDVRGEEDEAKHLDNMKDLLGKGKIHLVVYCFQMTKSLVLSSHKGALHKYHQIGVDWKRSIIALTFADALFIPKDERNDPYFKMSNFFDMRVAFWQDEVKKLVEELDVKSDLATQLKVFPTSLLPTDRLPNENSWYVSLWLHIVKILSPAASVRFVDIHRGNICDEQAPPLNQRVTVELKLGGDARNQLAHSIVATVEATGMVSNEDIRALLTTALESGVGVYSRLFMDEQARQSGSEPYQSREETMLRFKTFGERFVKEVRSRANPAFTAKLQRQEVIPESLENDIAAAKDNESANCLLLSFLYKQATCESLSKLLASMIEAEGYPVMNNLGRDIKAALGL